jgi:hypothetical protein
MHRFSKMILAGAVFLVCSGWGFFAHQKINRLAVFILPSEMIGFYKKNIQYLTEAAVNPDRRRYAVPGEAPRHYIDLDDYGDSAVYKLPRYWNDAVAKYGEDSLKAHGILPWQVYRMYFQLKEAFLLKDTDRILKVSAELGHYVSDAYVPLHTTRNYDGQKTGQSGIHGFWESRLPELYFGQYDFFVGKAQYIKNVQLAIWEVIIITSQKKDSVLLIEKQLFEKEGSKKFSFETKGRLTVKVVSEEYARHYHQLLHGMVERQFRASIKMTGSIWYTAWVDAGQPDLKSLINYKPTEEELKKRKEELLLWREKTQKARDHEYEQNE